MLVLELKQTPWLIHIASCYKLVLKFEITGKKINDPLSVTSADIVKSVLYSLQVNIPCEKICIPARVS